MMPQLMKNAASRRSSSLERIPGPSRYVREQQFALHGARYRADNFILGGTPNDHATDQPENRVRMARKYCPIHNPKPKHKEPTQRRRARTPMNDETELTILAGAYGEQMRELMRERMKERLTYDQLLMIDKAKFKLMINVIVLGTALLLVAAAFEGILSLQTTVNAEYNLGSFSVATIYAGSFASCLFLPPYFLKFLGCRGTLLICIGACATYTIANVQPYWYSLIPCGLLCGIFLAPCEAAKDFYITETGIEYSQLNYELPNEVVERFFGYFFAIYNLGRVIGNIASSRLFESLTGRQPPIGENRDETCGGYFVPKGHLSDLGKLNLDRPNNESIFSILGVYFCFSFASVVLILAFIPKLQLDLSSRRHMFRMVQIFKLTIEHLQTPKHFCLIPLTVYTGMQKAFVIGVYTRAFVGCSLGIQSIGNVMALFGGCSALSSVLFGPLFKVYGRTPLFMFGAAVNCALIFTLSVWTPNGGDRQLFYVIAACWGMGDGVWSTQTSGLYADLFNQELQVAFANHRLFESIGFVLTFLATPYCSTQSWLYLLLAVLLFGCLGYALVEMTYEVGTPSKAVLRTLLRSPLIERKLQHFEAKGRCLANRVKGSLSQTASFDPRKDITL